MPMRPPVCRRQETIGELLVPSLEWNVTRHQTLAARFAARLEGAVEGLLEFGLNLVTI